MTLADVAPDDARWIALWNEVWPPLATTPEEERSWHAVHPGAFVLQDEDGRVTGGAFALLEPGLPAGLALGGVLVRAAERGAGRGTALLGVVRARAAALGATGLRGHLWIGPDGTGQAALDWAGRAGFAETARELVVALSLREREPPEVDPPDGVRIVSWADEPGLAPQLHVIASEAIPDIPGEEDAVVPPLEEWLRNDMSGPYDRPEAVLVALAGDEAVGYAKLHLPAARGDVAVNDLTAVRRTWRGRGVAGALKRAQLGWAMRNGYTSLETVNEERNAPIRALNARFGYRPVGTWVRVDGSTHERAAT